MLTARRRIETDLHWSGWPSGADRLPPPSRVLRSAKLAARVHATVCSHDANRAANVRTGSWRRPPPSHSNRWSAVCWGQAGSRCHLSGPDRVRPCPRATLAGTATPAGAARGHACLVEVWGLGRLLGDAKLVTVIIKAFAPRQPSAGDRESARWHFVATLGGTAMTNSAGDLPRPLDPVRSIIFNLANPSGGSADAGPDLGSFLVPDRLACRLARR